MASSAVNRLTNLTCVIKCLLKIMIEFALLIFNNQLDVSSTIWSKQTLFHQ